MFPKVLDHARVLYYTPEDCYGGVYYSTGELAEHICYLAICKYENDSAYYLFGCNMNHEVVSDSPWESVDECMRVARCSYNGVISWVEME